MELSCELLLYYDGSPPEFRARCKAALTELPLDSWGPADNRGRAAARNALFKKAQGEYLLVMDSDAMLLGSDWLAQLWRAKPVSGVLQGGRSVEAKPPRADALRWHYTLKREIRSLNARKAQPYEAFMTGSFFIHREAYQKLRFDERLRGYGHEDTLFGWALAEEKIPITHLDLPFLFSADESAQVFLHKSAEAMRSLLHVAHLYPQYRSRFKMLRYADRLKTWRLSGLYRLKFKIFRSLIERNLKGRHPSLMLFDLWRLGILLQEMANSAADRE